MEPDEEEFINAHQAFVVWRAYARDHVLTAQHARILDRRREHHLFLNEKGQYELVEIREIPDVARGAVKAYWFERVSQPADTYVLLWAVRGTVTLRLPNPASGLMVMRPFGTSMPGPSPSNDGRLIVAGRRYLALPEQRRQRPETCSAAPKSGATDKDDRAFLRQLTHTDFARQSRTRMDRRQRLMATLQGKPVDRPAVSFYGINGLDQNPADPDPLNIYSHPSWRPLIELAGEKTDRILLRGVAFKEIDPDPLGRLARDETWVDPGGSRFTRRTVAAGNRTLTMQCRRDRDINTVWTTEHLLKDAWRILTPCWSCRSLTPRTRGSTRRPC